MSISYFILAWAKFFGYLLHFNARYHRQMAQPVSKSLAHHWLSSTQSLEKHWLSSTF